MKAAFRPVDSVVFDKAFLDVVGIATDFLKLWDPFLNVRRVRVFMTVVCQRRESRGACCDAQARECVVLALSSTSSAVPKIDACIDVSGKVSVLQDKLGCPSNSVNASGTRSTGDGVIGSRIRRCTES